MNIIDERDKRTIYRKLRKQEYDNILTLSTKQGQTVRLLDEGMVVDAYGSPLFYIRKGVLQAFYDALDESYVGSINIGHTDLATFPERIVGQWTKADLSLVDIGDGRKGLDVELRLMDSHPLVKALRLMPFSLGVSAEFGYHIDEEATKDTGIEILDGVNIYDFAIVGEAGNVNSSGIALKGEVMSLDKKLSEVFEGKDLAEINKKLDALLEQSEETPEEPVAEEAAEEVAEEVEEAVSEPEEAAEAEEAEEAPEAEEEAAEEASEVDLSVVLEEHEQAQARIAELEAQLTELRERLAARNKAEQEFVAKFKTLSVSLAKKEEPVVEAKPSYTDGIGE